MVKAIDLHTERSLYPPDRALAGTGCDLHRLMLVVEDITALARIKST
jgi:hypothetical protein